MIKYLCKLFKIYDPERIEMIEHKILCYLIFVCIGLVALYNIEHIFLFLEFIFHTWVDWLLQCWEISEKPIATITLKEISHMILFMLINFWIVIFVLAMVSAFKQEEECSY